MESLTRLVTESLACHGLDRPLDYARLPGSRWFRCESHPSLELTPEPPSLNWTHAPESGNSTRTQESGSERRTTTAARLNSAIATTIHCSSSFPSGF